MESEWSILYVYQILISQNWYNRCYNEAKMWLTKSLDSCKATNPSLQKTNATVSQFLEIRYIRAFYKANYIIQALTKPFIEKHFSQNIIINQTYYLWKHKAIYPLVFNNAPTTHSNSTWDKWWLFETFITRDTVSQNLNTIIQINYEKNTQKWLPMLKGKSPNPQRRGNKPQPTLAHTKAT